jgi:hypothetical protein
MRATTQAAVRQGSRTAESSSARAPGARHPLAGLGNGATAALLRPRGLDAVPANGLQVGSPADGLEREADRAADAVLRGEVPVLSRGGGATVQRRCSSCEEETTLQRKATSESAPRAAPPIVASVLRTQGRPLDSGVRSFMERRFATSFGDVRIHDDTNAAASARAVDAKAYTVGSQVVFGTGSYQPATPDGQRLIAHELAHVVQQRGRGSPHGASSPATGTLQRQGNDSPSPSAAPAAQPPSTVERALGLLERAGSFHPALAPLAAAIRILRGAIYVWNHRQELKQRLIAKIGELITTVPAAALAKAREYATQIVGGRFAQAVGCVIDQLGTLLSSLAQHWLQVLGSMLEDMLIVPLLMRAVPRIIDGAIGLADDIAHLRAGRAVDRGVEILTEINGIAGVFFLWYAIITTVIGGVAGSVEPGAGNAAGAAAGLTVAEVLGVILLSSVVATETARIVRGIQMMTDNWDDAEQRELACRQVAEGVFSLTLTAILFFLGPSIQRFARTIISRAAVFVRATVQAARTEVSAMAEGLSRGLQPVAARAGPNVSPLVMTPEPAAPPRIAPTPGRSTPTRAPQGPPTVQAPEVQTPQAARPTTPGRTPATRPTEPSTSTLPERAGLAGTAGALGQTATDPERRRRGDRCFTLWGLRPGGPPIHEQRAPIPFNGDPMTTVARVAFRLDRGVSPPRGQRTSPACIAWARAIGGRGARDDAGHAIAYRFGGRRDFNSSIGNIFPQDLSRNRGAMVVRDGEAAALHERGDDVCVEIVLVYPSASALRPSHVVHTILSRSRVQQDFVHPTPPRTIENPT